MNVEELNDELGELRSEIDDLRSQLEEIKQLLTNPSPTPKTDQVGHVQKMHNMHPDPSFADIMDKLENTCGEKGTSGCVAYLGVFASGGRQSNWIENEISTDDLLNLVQDCTASTVLSCIGSQDRMKVLMSLLEQPKTAAQLVESCGFNTTGQVYHHLKMLTSVDIVYSDRDLYIVRPHRIQGIIMLLAGIRNLIGTEYTKGSWIETGQPE